MKLRLVFIIAILLSSNTSILVAQGQTKRGKGTTRVRRTKAVKPKGETAAAPTKSSPVTTTPSGLIFVNTRSSNGRQPRSGETVIVHYTGILSNGVKFDSSLDREQPFSFKLGEGRVIKGWDEGIGMLRVGEQATLIIPAHLGYGATGAGSIIPPGATLIFIVELVGIEEAPASK